jgi:hypothetical protein
MESTLSHYKAKVESTYDGDIARVKTASVAVEIANYSVDQLKNKVERVREMAEVEPDDVRDIIRNAALHILNENVSSP